MNDFDFNNLRLEGISVIKASIDNPRNISIDESLKTVRFDINFKKLLNVELESILISINISIELLTEDSSPTDIKADFTIDFIFKVKDLKNYTTIVNTGEEAYSISHLLHATTLSIAYSTARGIIFNRCLGTIMGNVILPIVDLKTLIQLSNQDSNAAIPKRKKATKSKTKKEKITTKKIKKKD